VLERIGQEEVGRVLIMDFFALVKGMRCDASISLMGFLLLAYVPSSWVWISSTGPWLPETCRLGGSEWRKVT